MEFNQKLQELRKRKGLTQEDLAGYLFVSRTAVSKWESGRGYPNIDSLKAIAEFFGVTIDQLLSGDELLTIAENDSRQKENNLRDLVFGLLDCSAVMFFFLPLFGEKSDSAVQAVSLLSLSGISPYLKAVYFAVTSGLILWGIVTLALQNCHGTVWVKHKRRISAALHIAGVLILIISSQPYAATLLFFSLLMKAFTLIKWQ